MCKNLPIKSGSSKLAGSCSDAKGFMHQNIFPNYHLELDQVNCANSRIFLFEILTHGAHETHGACLTHGPARPMGITKSPGPDRPTGSTRPMWSTRPTGPNRPKRKYMAYMA